MGWYGVGPVNKHAIEKAALCNLNSDDFPSHARLTSSEKNSKFGASVWPMWIAFFFVSFFSFLSITPSLADRFVSSGVFEQGRRFFISFGESATQMSSMENSQLRRWFVVLGEGGGGVSLGWASRRVDVKSFPVRSPFTSSWFVSSGLFSGGRGFLLPFGERATQMSSMENSQLRRRYVFLGVFLWAGHFDTLM